VSSEERIHSG